MNKYEKAYKQITKKHGLSCNISTIGILVERATPIKPNIYTKNGYTTKHCPNCETLVGINECCSNNDCRQALDWSE